MLTTLPPWLAKRFTSTLSCDCSRLVKLNPIGNNEFNEMPNQFICRGGPLLVVASGRDTISVASSIKRLAPENVFLVQVKPFTYYLLCLDVYISITWCECDD